MGMHWSSKSTGYRLPAATQPEFPGTATSYCMTDPKGKTRCLRCRQRVRHFDASGRVATVQGTSGTTATTYANGPAANNAISYWGNGATHQVNLGGGGLSQTFSYNHRFWPSSVTATAGGSSLQREGT